MKFSNKSHNEKLSIIESKIASYPDFPKKGILFRDIMPILGDPSIFSLLVDTLCDTLSSYKFDRVLGIESRGFLIGPILANRLRLPFSPIRKKGKLPGELYSVDYDLEYGKDTLQIQKNGLPKNSKCIIVDDLVATGGSLAAGKTLVEMSESEVIACIVIIELKVLNAKEKLGNCPLVSLFSY